MITGTEQSLLDEMSRSFPGLDPFALELATAGGLAAAFPVSELASVSIGMAGLAAARLVEASAAQVDRQLASAWFGTTLEPVGWALPPVWDAISGDYRTRDGWIRLHANAPRHRAAALATLGVGESADEVRAAVGRRGGEELELAVVSAGGCAAVMRTAGDWAASAAGDAVRAQPLVQWRELDDFPHRAERAEGEPLRPLEGVRILDLTRVLAGPVATRFLALLGAEVLRIDPPDWDEGVIPEVMLGKRSARLDLSAPGDRRVLSELLGTADVIVHGYRPGALDAQGFGLQDRQALRPGLIDVSLDAYGWAGPLAGRRGFDSLVQMSTGIAHAGMTATAADKPVPLPVQALDHATGYLMAAAVLSALAHRRETGRGQSAQVSLARTAQLLLDRPGQGDHTGFASPRQVLLGSDVEETSWGPARRVRPPVSIEGVTLAASASRALGSDELHWIS